jgi:hypothetical protein
MNEIQKCRTIRRKRKAFCCDIKFMWFKQLRVLKQTTPNKGNTIEMVTFFYIISSKISTSVLPKTVLRGRLQIVPTVVNECRR